MLDAGEVESPTKDKTPRLASKLSDRTQPPSGGASAPSLIVVGTGRCGTLAVAEAIGGEHEPNRDPTVFLASAYSHGWFVPHAAAIILDQQEWPDKIVDYKQSELIDVTWPLWGPEYLWVVRNPADTVASMVHNNWYKPSDDIYPPGYLTFYQMHTPNLVSHNSASNEAGNRTRGDLTGLMTPAEWAGMSQVERCGWWWNFCNRRIHDALSRVPGKFWNILRIEDQKIPHANQSSPLPVVGWEKHTEHMTQVLGY